MIRYRRTPFQRRTALDGSGRDNTMYPRRDSGLQGRQRNDYHKELIGLLPAGVRIR